MYPFDDDWFKRRRKRSFDFFGTDDEFERMFIEMQRMIKRKAGVKPVCITSKEAAYYGNLQEKTTAPTTIG